MSPHFKGGVMYEPYVVPNSVRITQSGMERAEWRYEHCLSRQK